MSAIVAVAVSFVSGAVVGTPVNEVADGALSSSAAVLVVAMVRLGERPAGTAYERLVVDGALGLYLGWVCIATVANAAAALAALVTPASALLVAARRRSTPALS